LKSYFFQHLHRYSVVFITFISKSQNWSRAWSMHSDFQCRLVKLKTDRATAFNNKNLAHKWRSSIALTILIIESSLSSRGNWHTKFHYLMKCDTIFRLSELLKYWRILELSLHNILRYSWIIKPSHLRKNPLCGLILFSFLHSRLISIVPFTIRLPRFLNTYQFFI
jgi:hypothetical protein